MCQQILEATQGRAPLSTGAQTSGPMTGARAPSAEFAMLIGDGMPTDALALVLDELDYGVILLDGRDDVQFANYRALGELDRRQALQLARGRLLASDARDAQTLACALAGARRGVRRLIELGTDKCRIRMSVLPVGTDGVMLTLGRARLCEPLTIIGFAATYGLTLTETNVLEALCEGLSPTDIARVHGVAVSTVRTQIASIRDKTDTEGIDHLRREMATLPPIPVKLRCASRQAMPQPSNREAAGRAAAPAINGARVPVAA